MTRLMITRLKFILFSTLINVTSGGCKIRILIFEKRLRFPCQSHESAILINHVIIYYVRLSKHNEFEELTLRC